MKSFAKFYLRHNFLMNLEIKKIQSYFKADDFEELKNNRFLTLLNKAKKSEFYSEFYKDVDLTLIKSLNDIDKLPVLTKTQVSANNTKLLTKNQVFTIKGHTSGTTGSPLTVYRDYPSIIKENAYVWWYRMRCGLNPQDKKVSLRGDLDKNQLFYFEKVSNTLFISSYNLNQKKLPEIARKINDFKPKAILAYPSSVYLFCTLLQDQNIECTIPLTLTSSEGLMSYQRETAERVLNSKLYDWYGTTERSIALYAANNHYYEPPMYAVNEYQPESVFTTSLINNAFPLIRYEVNDVIKHSNFYDSDRKSLEIDEISGRIDDYILLKDGSKIGRLSMTVFDVKGIKNAQLIQNSTTDLTVNIVPSGDLEKEKLLKNLRRRLGDQISIQINEIREGDLIYSDSGKFKLVISKL